MSQKKRPQWDKGECMVDLKQSVQYVKGVGPNRVKILNSIGIRTLEDLITYFPRTYEDRSKPKNIAELVDGEEALIEVMATSNMSEVRIGKNRSILKLIVRDETAACVITWFNQSYLKGKFKVGQRYKFYGKAQVKYGKVEMVNPVYDMEENSKNTGKIIPIYPLTYNLKQSAIRNMIENGLKMVNGKLEETMPEYLLKEYHLMDRNQAMEQINFPDNFEEYQNARKRLVFEELLSMQLALSGLKNKYDNENDGIAYSKEIKMSDVINTLPFHLTKAQLRVLEEIDHDMESKKPMNRLLQGDVGSRKNSSISN